MDKQVYHDHANYAINLIRGRSLLEPSSNIVSTFGAYAINGLCSIEVRKSVIEKSKQPSGGAGCHDTYGRGCSLETHEGNIVRKFHLDRSNSRSTKNQMKKKEKFQGHE